MNLRDASTSKNSNLTTLLCALDCLAPLDYAFDLDGKKLGGVDRHRLTLSTWLRGYSQLEPGLLQGLVEETGVGQGMRSEQAHHLGQARCVQVADWFG